MTDKVIVLSTCGNATEAEKLARHLIDHRLAACVNVVPGLLSYYRWQGQVENDTELLLLIKTARGLVGEVHSVLQKLHSYELPELVVIPIVDGSRDYLDWLEGELVQEEHEEEQET
jgi:periplasmic divalent cation tolerance protein